MCTWCKEVKSIFTKCGLLDYYNGQLTTRTNIIASIDQKLILEQKAAWELSRNMPKLNNYNKIKRTFTVPKYVSYNLSIKERSSIAKMYCGINFF